MMRSRVCTGAAIMVWTLCSTMLMRPLKASSRCASRTRIVFLGENLIAHCGRDAETIAFVGFGHELIAFQQHEDTPLRADRLNREIQYGRQHFFVQGQVPGNLLAKLK